MSLARRTLRTTATAAGIAVLGIGLGGTAFAAPEAPEAPAPEPAATTDSAATDGLLTKVASTPTGMSDLPTAFTFENPRLNTSEPALPEAAEDGTAVNPRSVDPSSGVENLSVEQSQVGALANMDTAKAMSGLAGKAGSLG
jgi:hypothetical protein